uniref:CTP synthase n=1 Tax=Panagrolaimus davidi TaxID=227884 RepID=A0A914QZ33_9BILA
MDPCLNLDSRNLNPAIYGEKYCLIDGEIVSINFGYYERILDQIFYKYNYITRGKINDFLIKQNELNYEASKIRSSNVATAIIDWIKNVFHQPIDGKNIPSICIIELSGGTDDEISDATFFKALSEFKHKNDFFHIHVSRPVGKKFDFLIKSVHSLRSQHWQPDMIICRSENPINENHRKEIAQYGLLKTETDMVINLPKVSHIKYVPIILQEQNIYNLISKELHLEISSNFDTTICELRKEIKEIESYTIVVKIAIVGKYLIHPLKPKEIFRESCESMIQQLNIAAEKGCSCKIETIFVRAQDLEDNDEKQKAAWKKLKEAHAILVPGGTGSDGFKGLMKLFTYARENKKPILSICYGFQCAVTEFAQNICRINPGESYKETLKKINIQMLENGQTRKGMHDVTFITKNSKLFDLYGKKNFIKERNCNRMEINPEYIPLFISHGLRFVGIGFDVEVSEALKKLKSLVHIHDEDDEEGYVKTIKKLCDEYSHFTNTALRMQIFELKEHPYYIGVQYFPKCGGDGLRPSLPSPPFVGLIKAALSEMKKTSPGK